jgi:hypothetical protein
MVQIRAHLLESRANNLQASAGLGSSVTVTHRATVGSQGRGARDGDDATDTDGA